MIKLEFFLCLSGFFENFNWKHGTCTMHNCILYDIPALYMHNLNCHSSTFNCFSGIIIFFKFPFIPPKYDGFTRLVFCLESLHGFRCIQTRKSGLFRSPVDFDSQASPWSKTHLLLHSLQSLTFTWNAWLNSTGGISLTSHLAVSSCSLWICDLGVRAFMMITSIF